MLVLLLAAVTACSPASQRPEPVAAERAMQIVNQMRSEVEGARTGDDRRAAGERRRILEEIGHIAGLLRAREFSDARLALERLYWRLVRGSRAAGDPTYAQVILKIEEQVIEARGLLAGRE